MGSLRKSADEKRNLHFAKSAGMGYFPFRIVGDLVHEQRSPADRSWGVAARGRTLPVDWCIVMLSGPTT